VLVEEDDDAMIYELMNGLKRIEAEVFPVPAKISNLKSKSIHN
jgi:hypothetical protein